MAGSKQAQHFLAPSLDFLPRDAVLGNRGEILLHILLPDLEGVQDALILGLETGVIRNKTSKITGRGSRELEITLVGMRFENLITQRRADIPEGFQSIHVSFRQATMQVCVQILLDLR